MSLELVTAAKDDEPLLARLLELYAHDLSDVAGLRIGDDGRYGYEALPRYWTGVGRHPYLLRVEGELAGFVLVQQGSQLTGAPGVWDMAEFFVLRRHRRHGAGVRAAHAVWSKHAGHWEVRIMERNTAALAFWQRAVDAYVGAHVEAEFTQVRGKWWHVLRLLATAGSEPIAR
jgi:predicted acetyltransferase